MSDANQLVEALAAYAHDAWAGWMKYLFEKCMGGEVAVVGLGTKLPLQGVAVIPAALVDRWVRQMSTPYADLPEKEKESDRAEAKKIIGIVDSIIIRALAKEAREDAEEGTCPYPRHAADCDCGGAGGDR